MIHIIHSESQHYTLTQHNNTKRLPEFKHLIRRHDIFDLMFTLRGGISRSKYGLLHEGLFSKAMAGE